MISGKENVGDVELELFGSGAQKLEIMLSGCSGISVPQGVKNLVISNCSNFSFNNDPGSDMLEKLAVLCNTTINKTFEGKGLNNLESLRSVSILGCTKFDITFLARLKNLHELRLLGYKRKGFSAKILQKLQDNGCEIVF